MNWPLINTTRRILATERGTVIKTPGTAMPVALAYPNTYRVGMSNLGLHVMYQQINNRPDTACERVFLPAAADLKEYLRTQTPLFTLENQIVIRGCPLVAFAVSFELDYTNVLSMLDAGRIPLKRQQRTEQDPIVIMGGPCATFNPEPMSLFMDAFVIGEGEQVIHEVLDVILRWNKGECSRAQAIVELSHIEGIYVPSLYEAEYLADGRFNRIIPQPGTPEFIKRRIAHHLDRTPVHSVIMTPDTEFAGMYLVEITRGCGRHCRFCMAGYCFRQPRARSLESVIAMIEEGRRYCNRIGLVGAAISDYPWIDELSEYLLHNHIAVSVASLRADSLSEPLMKLLAYSGHKTITLAPEAGSEQMRRVINKGLTLAQLKQAILLAAKYNIHNVKLYIMIGLPGETDNDISAIGELALMVQQWLSQSGVHKYTATLSINAFIPKPFTPFQWSPMDEIDILTKKLKTIEQLCKHEANIKIITESPKWSYIQALLARGDRTIAEVLLTAWQFGGSFGAWKKALKQNNVNGDSYVYRSRQPGEPLPWQHIAMGFDTAYLVAEEQKAHQQQFTPRCQPTTCHRCGVC